MRFAFTRIVISQKGIPITKTTQKYNRYDVIIIDDIGYVHQNKEEMEVLFTMMAERYETGSLIITAICHSQNGKISLKTQ